MSKHAPRRHRRGLARACAATATATAAADGCGAGARLPSRDETSLCGDRGVRVTHLYAERATRDGLGGVGDRDHVPEEVQGCGGAGV